MKRTARKYPPDAASDRDELLMIIGGIIMLAAFAAPVEWFVGALVSGTIVLKL